MTGNDMTRSAFAPRLSDIALSLGLLTRLPLPASAFPDTTTRPAGHAAWAYPVTGLAVGVIVLAVASIAVWLGLSTGIAALLALLSGTVITGAMHEDGFADCADGFWGGWTAERRLEIMKDSQIGTYGVIALIGSFGLRWSAITLLLEAQAGLAILGATILSRAAMAVVMTRLGNARQSGLSHMTGAPPSKAAWLAVGLGLVAVFVWVPAPVACVFVVTAVTAGWMAIARAKIGGQTGDVLGATQQLVEISVLMVSAATLT